MLIIEWIKIQYRISCECIECQVAVEYSLKLCVQWI